MIIYIPSNSSIDMLFVLSQLIVKVPLSELLRIPEHRKKAIAWVGGVDEKVKYDCNESHTPREGSEERMKEKEPKES